jgi:hypothetical protein
VEEGGMEEVLGLAEREEEEEEEELGVSLHPHTTPHSPTPNSPSPHSTTPHSRHRNAHPSTPSSSPSFPTLEAAGNPAECQKMQNVLALRGGEEEDASLPHGGGEEEEKQNVLALRIQCAVRSWLARQSAQNLAVERATALHHQGVLNIECVLYR